MKHINTSVFTFLKEIAANNNREWFAENKQRYLDIKKQLEIFAAHWHSQVRNIDESVAGVDCKPYFFRIYRDARFAKWKPYKQNIGILIGEGWKPNMYRQSGYYLHIEPGNTFLVSGAYMPEALWLKSRREDFMNTPEKIKKILSDPDFTQAFELRGKQLKTAPRGIQKDHPEIELLRYKSFYALHNFTDKEVMAKGFFESLIDLSQKISPFTKYLNSLER